MKSAQEVSIIGGADGPTSIFIAGKSTPKTWKGRIRQCIYKCRRSRVEKRIRVTPHTLKQVVAVARRKYHAVEVPQNTKRYREQYRGEKAALILRHRPGLLGGLAEITPPDVWDGQSAKAFLRQAELRAKRAVEVSDREMPMDFHMYEIRIKGGHMEMQIDFKWDTFGMSYSGSPKAMKKLKKIQRSLYVYYGVSEEDKKNRTERYLSLVSALSS